MTNEEKAKGIANLCEHCIESNGNPCVGCKECDARGAYYGALEMAEWKDQQFKEYLEKKREELFNTNCLSVLPYIEFIDEIINELFPEQEQDNSDNDE